MSKPNFSRYKYTPQMVETMPTSAVRHAYAYLQSVINKRARRIAAKGYGQYEAGQKLPPQSTYSDADIRAALLSASQRARDPESFAGGFEERLQRRVTGLQQAGYESITTENVGEFWKFMQHTKRRTSKNLFDSHIAAQVYNMARSRGVSARTIEKQFASYMTSSRRMEQLYDAIESFNLPSGRKRMSSTEIRARL